MSSFGFATYLLGLFFAADAHSWMWYLEGDVDEGLARMGYIGLDDDYYTRYVCPLASLEECALAPRHNIELTESSMRPCRATGSPGAPNINDLAVVNAGKKLRILWRNNGHAENGESEGTCVEIRITPYQSDPDWTDFTVLDSCMPYHRDFDTSGYVTIPEDYAAGKYTINWMWKFGPFYFGACADVLVENANGGSNDPSTTTKTTVSGDGSAVSTTPPPAAAPTPSTTPSAPTTATSGGSTTKSVYEQYQDHGCTGLDNPGKFCYDYFGTYCKGTAGLDACGRSICHLSSHDDLYPCGKRSLRSAN
ncbi:hypothetical protein FOZ63_001205 [Perkinsus olseni]|uniref:Chitin-binding type-4 domain-containing protein n=1 Tax=Perkinsus olseni TaxID=32597 RepID=A0A7J6NZ31_PEROL|nr:hypothetical protein FOZ63_001205 [Perkinsus olseni]